MEFHERLKELRKSMNYTQEDLAKKLGVTAGSIGLYEQNRREPDNDTVKQLAAIFNVSIDYLLGYSGSSLTIDSRPHIISHYENVHKGDSMTFDDFTYAMYNETKDLTEEQKIALLNMAKTLKSLNDK